jgi:hypothetical protein
MEKLEDLRKSNPAEKRSDSDIKEDQGLAELLDDLGP